MASGPMAASLEGAIAQVNAELARERAELEEEKRALKRARTELDGEIEAMTKIGVSVFHAALTTMLSVIMLLFCNVTLFVKFGQIILVSVVISIIFALVPLPAMLGMLGPKRFRRSFKRQLFMLAALVSLMLCCLVILYGLDASGRIELVGPAGEPLFGRAVRVDNGALEDV